jgi:outer membrane usher protein FimD/PapC
MSTQRILRSLLALKLLIVSGAFMIAVPANASDAGLRASPPDGFEDLTEERKVVLDAFFGGAKLGEVVATISPGRLRFDDPAAVADLIPGVISRSDLAGALTGSLATNAALVCRWKGQQACGTLLPPRAGIILDEDRFRVDIFVHPTLLAVDRTDVSYLTAAESEPSLVSLFGATLSGSTRGRRAYHVQNRSIASLGALRVRSDSSVAKSYGLSFDNLTVEADRRSWRYVGGVFWAPGSELTGRRKVAGAGIATQLDTRTDRIELIATPLTVFLQQSSRVELLVQGRVVASRILPAGQQSIDTSALPDGSYNVTIRIQEDGGPARTETRFFTKGVLAAPLGHPLISAFAGFLQSGNRSVRLEHKTFFYQASARYRRSQVLGLDATIVGSQHKAVLETGAILFTPVAQVRLVALASSAGDYGAAVRASTLGRGPVAFSFDLQRVNSRDGRALLPVSSSNGTFSEDPELRLGDQGTYTQGIGALDYRFAAGTLRLSGLYRRGRSGDASYSLAASLDAPVVQSNGWDLRFQADVRKGDRELASFVGVRFLKAGGGVALSGLAGASHGSGRRGGSTGLVGETQAAWTRQLSDLTQLGTDVALGQTPDNSYARSSSHVRSPLGNVRSDLLYEHGGGPRNLQFAGTVDGGIVVGGGRVGVAGREPGDSAAIVSVSGSGSGQTFDVLVDEVVRGTVSSGQSLALYLAPYATYEIRLRSREASVAGIDTAARKATLFPGTVAKLDWTVTPLVIVFGRAVDPVGRPIASADISGPHGIARTDEQGFFQIEAARQDRLTLVGRTGTKCTLGISGAASRDGYISAGDVICR